MNGKIVVFDFSGTILKKDVAKEASNRRFKSLGKEVDQEWLDKALVNNEHYGIINDIISKYTGIKDKDKLTIMSTNFFKFHVFGVANERKDEIFQDGIIKLVEDLRKKGNRIAIVSGIRTDIIEGILEIVEKRSLFDFILGQPPQLGVSNEELLKQLQEKGEISFVIGDKINDILAGKAIKAQTIFVTWGHHTGEEEKKADFIVKHASEILEIVNAYKDN
jgi:phosphoglycolate phosphatase-like HAD superfamily hydrolase